MAAPMHGRNLAMTGRRNGQEAFINNRPGNSGKTLNYYTDDHTRRARSLLEYLQD